MEHHVHVWFDLNSNVCMFEYVRMKEVQILLCNLSSKKFMKSLLDKDKITKNIFQQESLEENGHSKKNKWAVFEFSKNFVARFKGHKIPQKHFKFIIWNLVF